MSSLFDRVREELDHLGDRVSDALKSSQLHLERSSLTAVRGKAYLKLGRLVYRKERGGEAPQAELDALYAQLDDLTAKITKIDEDLEKEKASGAPAAEAPAPAAAPSEAPKEPTP